MTTTGMPAIDAAFDELLKKHGERIAIAGAYFEKQYPSRPPVFQVNDALVAIQRSIESQLFSNGVDAIVSRDFRAGTCGVELLVMGKPLRKWWFPASEIANRPHAVAWKVVSEWEVE